MLVYGDAQRREDAGSKAERLGGGPWDRRPEGHGTVKVWHAALKVPSLYQAFTSIR